VFSTSLGIYVTAVTTSSDGDIRGDGSAVGILRLDTSGSIVSALSLDFSYAHEYVSAQITSCGIVVATSPEDKSYLYLNIVPYDLSGSSAYRISYAESAVIFPTDTSFIIFAEYSDECLAYSYSENGFAFQSIGTGKVAELFEYGSYYVIISNDTAQNKYSVIKLAKNTFNVISCAETDGATVISVTPVIADGTQYFIVLENKNGSRGKKIRFDAYKTACRQKTRQF
jgi:D-alanine-D-alanine ligase-like ATP-grasp enzyme